MKAIVITLIDSQKSNFVADRCINSAKKNNIKVEKFPACDATQVDIEEVFKENNLPTENFYDAWSRASRAMGCFFSHYSAWAMCEAINEPILILEHDAVFRNSIDLDSLEFNKILNIGKPSFGKFVTPKEKGVQPFISNPQGYVKGAHAYVISPEGAKDLIKTAHEKAGPTDLFICTQNFPYLQEYTPWPVIAKDTFSTVQAEKGIRAKHEYNKNYKVI